MNKFILLLFLTNYYCTLKAQSPADSTAVIQSPVKSLNNKQYNALLTGEDLYNMSKVAELNHYPSPLKVIKFKKELDLSPIQVNKLNVINKELRRKILEMGLIVIKNERTLDSLFHHHNLTNGSLIFYTNRYGLYQGELRNVILQSCFVTRGLLSQQQINKYEKLAKNE